MSPVLPTSLDSRTKSARSSLKNWPWRPIACCAGALGIGLSLSPFLLKAPTVRTDEEAVAEIVLPAESTLVVAPTLPPGALLRGQIRLVADVLGRAPVGGQVARHVVENGARVRRGDAVVEISSGVGKRAALPSEFRQNRAEQGQIAAADAQTALSQKMAAAQNRLLEAQERVNRSQAQVGVARDIVRRLQNGAVVASAEIPAPFRGESPQIEPFRPSKSRKSRGRRASRTAENSNRSALRQVETAREAAKQSVRDLKATQKTLLDAQNDVRGADDKLQSAIQNVADVEARFSAKKASGADVETARALQKEAQLAANSADKAFLTAKSEVEKREKNVVAVQSSADSAASQAAKNLSSARLDMSDADSQVRDSAESPEAPQQAPASVSPGRVTLEQAIRFAGATLDESRRASRDAERIHSQIEGYQSQVTKSQSRVEAATQDLVSAQQKVLDSVPRPRFTASYAPADGVVMWISRLAREVGAGQAVFGLARGEKVAAHFEDKSGLWRGVKKNATMPAFLVDNSNSNASKSPSSGQKISSDASSNGKNENVPDAGYPVQVKITEIESPQEDGSAATLIAEVRGGPGTGASPSLREGAGVLIPMPRPNQKATLSVPSSALVRRGAATYLAVLSPAEISSQSTATTATTPSSTPQKINDSEMSQKFHLAWQLVETGRSDGLRLEITSGLKAGTRVVALPEQLEAMGFAPASAITPPSELTAKPGSQPNESVSAASTVSDVSHATPSDAEASQIPVDVWVRLAPALT